MSFSQYFKDKIYCAKFEKRRSLLLIYETSYHTDCIQHITNRTIEINHFQDHWFNWRFLIIVRASFRIPLLWLCKCLIIEMCLISHSVRGLFRSDLFKNGATNAKTFLEIFEFRKARHFMFKNYLKLENVSEYWWLLANKLSI